MKIPCPHFNIQIVSRGKGRSVVAAAAYQSGQTLYSQYTGKWEPGEHEGRIVHTEILLPPNAPREYVDRQTLWNAVDASEKGQDAQTARRFIIALPKELTIEQNIELIRNYCQTTFVDKGMIADIAVHFNDEDPPNPHAHILLTMRSMDEHGKWQAKSKNMYALDENGNRIIAKNGKPKRIKVNTVDWNDPGNCERWRHEWEVQQNMALEEAGRSERIDMRSYERQGVEVIPETHLGPAASALEKQGIRTRMGDHNNAVRMINSLFKAVKRKVKEFGNWLKGLTETISDHKKIENPYDYHITDVLMAYVDMRRKEREGWNHSAQSKYGIRDLSELMITCNYLRDHGIETVHDFGVMLNEVSQSLADMKSAVKAKEKRIRDIDSIIDAAKTMRDLGPVLEKYNSMHFKSFKEKYLAEHGEEIDKVKKAQWLLKKLKVEMPINAKSLRQESKHLRGEVESLLPKLEGMKSEMEQLTKIRYHIRKVMPDVLEVRDTEGRRTFEDYSEEQSNRRELEELLQETADQVLALNPSDDTPERQTEVTKRREKEQGSQSHDEAR